MFGGWQGKGRISKLGPIHEVLLLKSIAGRDRIYFGVTFVIMFTISLLL